MGDRIDRLVLIGLRRSGKSTAARLVAPMIGWCVADVDERVLERTGRSPADWIRNGGLPAFREAERAAVAEIAELRRVVISTGGGTPLCEKNRAALRAAAWIVYLRADPCVLAERAGADRDPESRPPIADAGSVAEEAYLTYVERDALYRNWCDVIVDASRPVPEVVRDVVSVFRRAAIT
jgi:shikimate kinase